MFEFCNNCITKKEFRFRDKLCAYLSAYFEKHGDQVFIKMKEQLIESINDAWKRTNEMIEEESKEDPNAPLNPLIMKEKFKTRSDLNIELEAYYKVILAFVDGISKKTNVIDKNLFTVIFKTQKHSKQEIRSLG